MQVAQPKIPACMLNFLRLFQQFYQASLFLLQCAKNGNGFHTTILPIKKGSWCCPFFGIVGSLFFIAQFASQNLANRGFRKLSSELHHFWLLVTCEIFLAEGAYLRFSQVRAFLDNDQLDGLA